jgi:hypothetical protein
MVTPEFPKTFRGIFYRLLPHWLTRGEGELVLFSLGAILDAAMERTRQGLLARFPQYAPDDALAYIGQDRLIARGIEEDSEAYAARMITWLDDHRTRGNAFTLMRILRGYLNAPVRLRTVDRNGNWYTHDRDGTLSYALSTGNWNWAGAPPSQWSRFWVVIYPDNGNPWSPISGELDDGGEEFESSDRCVGLTATPGQIATIRAIIRAWMPDGTRCEWVIVAFDDASFDPTAPEPDGTWGPWGRESGGVTTPTRLDTARYFAGVDGSERA